MKKKTEKTDFKMFTDKELIKELKRRKYHIVDIDTHYICESHEIGYRIVKKKDINNHLRSDITNKIKKEINDNLHDWIEDFFGGDKGWNHFTEHINTEIERLEEELETK